NDQLQLRRVAGGCRPGALTSRTESRHVSAVRHVNTRVLWPRRTSLWPASEAHDRPHAQFKLLRQSSRQDDDTAADLDRATRPSADFRFNPDRQPVGCGAYGEPGAQELFQAGSEPERKPREAVIRRGDMRGADAGCQKRSKTLDFRNLELAGEVRVKLVQRH